MRRGNLWPLFAILVLVFMSQPCLAEEQWQYLQFRGQVDGASLQVSKARLDYWAILHQLKMNEKRELVVSVPNGISSTLVSRIVSAPGCFEARVDYFDPRSQTFQSQNLLGGLGYSVCNQHSHGASQGNQYLGCGLESSGLFLEYAARKPCPGSKFPRWWLNSQLTFWLDGKSIGPCWISVVGESKLARSTAIGENFELVRLEVDCGERTTEEMMALAAVLAGGALPSGLTVVGGDGCWFPVLEP